MDEQERIEYEYVAAQPRLDSAADLLSSAPKVAVDLECDNNLHHFGTRVCLIQISTQERNFIVDAQAGLDLRALKKILEDERIEKVMHDTDFDLRCLDHEYGCRPKNLFDTQLAARLCGHKEIGLAALLNRYFGVALAKQFQRADWTRRPLSSRMLDYAAADSHFLLELRERLGLELAAAGRMEWALEEFKLREEIRFEQDDRPAFARVKGAAKLKGRPLAILASLAEAREEIAQELDLPPYQVISNEALIVLALRVPRASEDLARAKGMHPYCTREGAARLIDAIGRGTERSIPKWPRSGQGHRRHESPQLLQALKSWRSAIAADERIDADIIFPMQAMKRLAAGDLVEQVLSEPPVRRWQRERFGSMIEAEVRKSKSSQQH